MQHAPTRIRRVIRRMAGAPVATVRVPSRLPLLLDRHQARFDSITLPPLPAPMLLVHTAGKPLDYQASVGSSTGHSLPGFMSFVPRNTRAEVRLRGVTEGTLILFDAPRAALPEWLVNPDRREPFTRSNEVIVAIARRLMAGDPPGRARDPYQRALGNALVCELQRELAAAQSSLPVPPSRGGLRVAHEAMQHMRTRLGERLTVHELAAACGIGVTAFTAQFRAATGMTPHRYLRRARIEQACHLLRATALSVREVAAAVGFRGQGHFCTAFVAECGLTPTAYRKASRAGIAVLRRRSQQA